MTKAASLRGCAITFRALGNWHAVVTVAVCQVQVVPFLTSKDGGGRPKSLDNLATDGLSLLTDLSGTDDKNKGDKTGQNLLKFTILPNNRNFEQFNCDPKS